MDEATPDHDLETLRRLAEKYPFLFHHDDPRDRRTVGEIIAAYLPECRTDLSREAYGVRRFVLEQFNARHGAERVGVCNPLMLKTFVNSRPEWASGWTRKNAFVGVNRAFNWAVEMRLIRENPFRGPRVDFGKRKTGRDLAAAAFQALLRHAPPFFKRFLMALKLTGARPCELRRLRWEHVQWGDGLAVLPWDQHKTGKKTRRPRVIVLVPAMLKLLAVIRRDQRGVPASDLCQVLRRGEPVEVAGVAYLRMTSARVVKAMKARGHAWRTMAKARKRLGCVVRRIGYGRGGFVVVDVPVANLDAAPPAETHVFLGIQGQRLKPSAIGTMFIELRKRIGLPKDATMYGLRHAWITNAVKRGVNLKAVATLAGHSTTAMIEAHYCHLDRDIPFLHQAAAAATALGSTPAPLPMPVNDQATEALAATHYAKVEPKEKREPRLSPRCQAAYDLYRVAIDRCPDLREKPYQAAHAWLAGQEEFRDRLPKLPAFARYLTLARKQLGETSDNSAAGKKGARQRWAQ